MKRTATFFLVLILWHCSGGEDTNPPENTPPNIIFIMVDDLGKEWISCYGAEDIVTPNIDELAQSGIRFNNVYGMPQCTPSRVTLLTGQYPFRHGWINHWDVPRWGGGAHFDETRNPSLAVELRKAGYKTCVAGKWQIDDFRVEPDALTKTGFDEYCMWTGYEAGNPPSSERYHSPYIFTKNGSKTYEDEFGPDVFKNFICDFIRANKDTSMFIYYPMVLTHTPLVHTPIDSPSTKIGKHKAMVKYTDLITGDIIKTLEETGIRNNTIVMWTTDNGTTRQISGTVNGRQIEGAKAKTSEVGVCLPFIVSWPAAVDAGQTSNALIDFTDVFPTFLDLAGVDLGQEYKIGDRTHVIDGMSFKRVLVNKEDSQREWILAMGGGNNARLTEKGVENQYVFRDRVLRNERYKLYINSQREAVGFYDLIESPAEDNNLIDSLTTQARKDNFDQLYQIATRFPETDVDPRYQPNPEQEWDVDITAESQVWKKQGRSIQN